MRNLLLALLLAVTPLTFQGCKTPQVSAYKTEGIVITTADSALKAYSTYSQTHTPSKAEYEAIESAWNKYYDAQQVAKFALKVYIAASEKGTATDAQLAALQAAESNVASASTAIIDLVKGFLK